LTSPDLSSLLDSLYSLERRGIKLGLEHTISLLIDMGQPQNDLKLIHVAGTNGKGSTSAIIANILYSAGKKVGLFTSPHLVRFNERIQINNVPISDNDIIQFMRKAEQYIAKNESTFFETTAVMALDYFNKNKVDIAVIETGLGGRLDSTNVIKPQLTIMTPISMDHMDILGQDINQIAKEKSGIIKKNIPLISSKQSSIVKNILVKKAMDQHAPFTFLESISNIKVSERGTEFQYKEKNFYTSLIGIHQAHNSALAIEAITQMNENISMTTIQKGLKSVSWPGRIQRIGKRLFYDVAHNEDGFEILLKTLRSMYPQKLINGLFCLKGDKESDRIIHKLIGKFSQLYVSNDVNKFLLDRNDLSKRLNNNGVENQIVKSVSDGIKKLRFGTENGDVGLIFGSHYIANEVFMEDELSFDTGVI
jgi:dihydrofolate synthase/folylpolyglutamate synthase